MAVIVPIIAARCHSNCNIDLSGFGEFFYNCFIVICFAAGLLIVSTIINETINYYKNIYNDYKQRKQEKLMASYKIMESKFKNESKDEV